MLISNLAASLSLSKDMNCHTLRFDFTGNGHSSGQWKFGNYENEYMDLCYIYNFVTCTLKCDVQCIIGHSQGSCAIMRHAATITMTPKEEEGGAENKEEGKLDLPLYVNLSGRCVKCDDFNPQTHWLTKNKCAELSTTGKFSMGKRGEREMIITTQDIERKNKFNMLEYLPNIKAKVLTIHGDKDSAVPPSNAKSFDGFISDHRYKFVSGADHNYNGLLFIDNIVSIISLFINGNI
mmetsp:Transcript_20457/g.23709  ORF Transcript_20457/g.23709 Transcript_20457/m.23709 type:complete len:236 (-) Transcript_20457:11-718(-)